MSEELVTPTKKRKLRHPRTLAACTFCKKRKVRCSGSQPCDVCRENEVKCEYPESALTSLRGSNNALPQGQSATTKPVEPGLVEATSPNESTAETPRSSAKYKSGDTVDLAVGTSFLYHVLSDTEGQDDEQNPKAFYGDVNSGSVPLTSHGDALFKSSSSTSALRQPFQPLEAISSLIEQYFQYICPTYRFLHRPTVLRWARNYAQSESMAISEHACLLLVCAQTLLHQKDVGAGSNQTARDMSETCFKRAKSLLSDEPSPPLLSSVQARLAMCLYLLSTFRLTECRFSFSFATTIVISLGLHRAEHLHQDDLLSSESRRRTFWSAYILDGYLSVMLGQPKLLKDEDIDQCFPQNIDDDLLESSLPVDSLPHHGNIEAFIAHAKLAQLMAHSNTLLYPLTPLETGQTLERSDQTLDALLKWQDELPTFLKSRNKTYTGLRTFERQNTILKLASAHVQILASRKSILLDEPSPDPSTKDLARKTLHACLAAVMTVLTTVDELVTHGQCYDAFWTTQYISLVALSTLYVYIIQAERGTLVVQLPGDHDVDKSFELAIRCHDHLARLPPDGSHEARHHVLLARLRDMASTAREKSREGLLITQHGSQAVSQQRYEQQIFADPGGVHDTQAAAVQLTEANDTLVSMTDMLNWTSELPDFTWSSFDVIG